MQGGGQADAVSRAPALDESLARAHQLAVSQGHGAVALEHLLFALTDDPDAVLILGASRISVDQLRTDVSAHLGRLSEAAPVEAGVAPRPGADLLRILQLAGMAARQSQRRLMDGGIVLAAIIGDGNSSAAGLLKAHGLTFEDVIRVLQTSGAPRQQEIASPPPRAELPPPQPAPAPALRAQPRDAPQQSVGQQSVTRQSTGDDALAPARSRVRQSEPQVVKPLVPLPSPEPPVAPAPLPQPPNTVVAAERQPLRPEPPRPESPRPEPLRQEPLRPEPQRVEHRPIEQRPIEQPPPSTLVLEAPSAPRRDMPPPAPERMEPTQRPRVASLEPVAVPRESVAAEQPLARLRPSQPNAPAAYQPAPQPSPPGPPPHRSPPQYPRPVPAVAPRPQAPYPYAPPPGPRPPVAHPSMPRPDLPSQPSPLQPPPSQALPPHTLLPAEPLEIVHAAAGLPAVVRRNVAVLVEIRIPRAQVDVPRQGPSAPPPGIPVLRAVTTRLTGGPVSGLSIEPRTAETAWLGPAEADNRDVIWQYVLLPTRAGTFAVTLSVSGRTIAPNGMLTDTSTSAETFAVRVKPERGRFSRRLLSTLVLLLLGGAIGWALTGPLSGIVKALAEMARG